ncbi:ArdC family protein [Caenispirillum bisanense]|uniref:Antirestriction protein ArdC n=1 Tax=Caenispirillum bisanense TaxID=414052 RepID=A0A286H165_9PROT|nr:zincin-like metallopeptidase domain-containing protein [Caenispirillum bisanense]SOE01530.1 Antirestriction protein ArdC [Caenispirillum bisanense]
MTKGTKRQASQRQDHYQIVTDRIIAALEAGTPPWRKPWDAGKAAMTGPLNAVTGHRYRGINVLLLGMDPKAWETGDPRWCSYKQAQDKGWQVRKGEKASTVFFFKTVEVENRDRVDDNGDPEKAVVPVLRSYPVFHASQIEGIPAYEPPTIGDAPWRRPEAVETILANSGVSLRVGGDKAFYSPSTDHIQLPPDGTFSSVQAWAATAMHELGHATGHPSRLDRDLRNRFGSRAYAQEELRAELASAFMAAELGIPAELEQHASYIGSWLETLKQDKREIFRAAADAQRAADWCLTCHPDYAATLDATTKDKEAESTPIAACGVPLPPQDEEMPDHLKAALGMSVPTAQANSAPAYGGPRI